MEAKQANDVDGLSSLPPFSITFKEALKELTCRNLESSLGCDSPTSPVPREVSNDSETFSSRKSYYTVCHEPVVLFPRRKAGQAAPNPEDRKPLKLSTEILETFFQVPLHIAARELGICQTAIKKVCRKLGIKRWPYKDGRLHSRARSISSLSHEAPDRGPEIIVSDPHPMAKSTPPSNSNCEWPLSAAAAAAAAAAADVSGNAHDVVSDLDRVAAPDNGGGGGDCDVPLLLTESDSPELTIAVHALLGLTAAVRSCAPPPAPSNAAPSPTSGRRQRSGAAAQRRG